MQQVDIPYESALTLNNLRGIRGKQYKFLAEQDGANLHQKNKKNVRCFNIYIFFLFSWAQHYIRAFIFIYQCHYVS